jgi:hypothetical protein
MENPIEELESRVSKSSQAYVANELGISPQYLNDVLRRRREVGKKILDALGLERVVGYVKSRGKRR